MVVSYNRLQRFAVLWTGSFPVLLISRSYQGLIRGLMVSCENDKAQESAILALSLRHLAFKDSDGILGSAGFRAAVKRGQTNVRFQATTEKETGASMAICEAEWSEELGQ